MRRLACIVLLTGLAAAQPPKGSDDPILRAMVDELARLPELKLPGLDDRPYFAEYSLEDVNAFSVAASLGALINVGRNRTRVPQVAVRVGSYEFDNTNHVYSTQASGPRYDGDWPLDNDYLLLREKFWLATDRAYKNAVEALSRKRASLRNAASPEKLPDFAPAKPAVYIEDANRGSFDEEAWKVRARDLSGIFLDYPEIFASGVETGIYLGTSYLVNSEGSRQRTAETLVTVRAQAMALASDGMALHDIASFASLKLDGVPPDSVYRRGVQEIANNIRDLLKAPVGESYSGPVLFEPVAAGQLMAQLIGDNARLTRRPVTDPGRPPQGSPGELDSKLGSRILPDWISITDDATQSEWQGQPLLGVYNFDMEGVAPQPLALVEKGTLKNFLLSRQPVGNYNASNGHGRLPGAFGARMAVIGNLFVSASQTKPMADLKRQLIDMCRERNRPYGLLVRKLDYPSSASIGELQSMAATLRGSSSRPVSSPVLVYRVYLDGREELVRGLRFRGLNTRSLRDILAASSETAVFGFVNNGAPLAHIAAGGFLAPASVVSPGLLFEEVELERAQENLAQPPLVPPPPMEAGRR